MHVQEELCLSVGQNGAFPAITEHTPFLDDNLSQILGVETRILVSIYNLIEVCKFRRWILSAFSGNDFLYFSLFMWDE